MYHPAAFERAVDSINGVCTHGCFGSWFAMLPMMKWGGDSFRVDNKV